MKKTVCSFTVSMVCMLTIICSTYAQDAMTVSGNDYTVFMLCMGDAGNYCQQNEFKQDIFKFDSDGTFEITSLEDEKEVIDTSDGSYNASVAGFNGNYDISTDFMLKKYEFSFIGFSIIDVIILGRFSVTYYELGGIPPDYDQQGEAQAYFLGIRN